MRLLRYTRRDRAARTIQRNWKAHRSYKELQQFKANITRIQRRLRSTTGLPFAAFRRPFTGLSPPFTVVSAGRLGVWAAQTKTGRTTRLQRLFRERRSRC